MRMAVRGARPTTENIAAMPTTANAPWLSEAVPIQKGSTNWAKPLPIAAPMNSDGMKAPPDAPDEVVRAAAGGGDGLAQAAQAPGPPGLGRPPRQQLVGEQLAGTEELGTEEDDGGHDQAGRHGPHPSQARPVFLREVLETIDEGEEEQTDDDHDDRQARIRDQLGERGHAVEAGVEGQLRTDQAPRGDGGSDRGDHDRGHVPDGERGEDHLEGEEHPGDRGVEGGT